MDSQQNSQMPTTQPEASQEKPTKKRNKIHLIAALILALLVSGLAYYTPIEGHVSQEFCTTRSFGLIFEIQKRLVVEKVEVVDPFNGPVMTECLHGAGYENTNFDQETTSINWINWFLNFLVVAIVFELVALLVMYTRWYLYFLLPIVWFVMQSIGFALLRSNNVITGG